MIPSDRTAGHILIAEDEAALSAHLAQHLVRAGHRVTTVSDGRSALAALQTASYDVAVLDIALPAPDGLEVLRALADDSDPPAIVVAAPQGSVEAAVQAMRFGAFAYLSKPYRVAELDVVIARAMEHRLLANANAALRAQVARSEGTTEFLTQYAPLHAVFTIAVTAAQQDDPVLIVGAPGTGKCALARAIHARSPRAGRSFLQLEPGQIAGDECERMLFGNERNERKAAGRAALATRGTLYLQDVLAMTTRVQHRLAGALGSSRYQVNAMGEERSVRARLIAAANGRAEAMDTYLSTELASVLTPTTITLPSLRERAVDIPLLASAFLARAGDVRAPRFDDDAMAALHEYSWPGNVAELKAVVERARLLARDGVIRVMDLALAPEADSMRLDVVERRHIEAVLYAKGWHQGKASATLGISPKTLYRKIREFGLKRPTGDNRA